MTNETHYEDDSLFGEEEALREALSPGDGPLSLWDEEMEALVRATPVDHWFIREGAQVRTADVPTFKQDPGVVHERLSVEYGRRSARLFEADATGRGFSSAGRCAADADYCPHRPACHKR